MSARLLLALPALLLLTGCSTTSIAEIRRDAGRFDGRTVTLRGRVGDVNQVPLLGIRTYKLQDDSGEIWVMASEGLPGRDEKVVVKGTVGSMAILGSSPLGLHLKESSRSRAWW